jgi:hypothetical protein
MPKSRAIVWRRSTVRANTLAIQWEYQRQQQQQHLFMMYGQNC